MKKWFVRYFIPTEANGYRPEFLFYTNFKQLVGVVIFFELAFFILPTLFYPQYFKDLNLGSVLPGVLSTLTNVERERNSLPVLVENPVLSQVAQLKADDMAAKGYFAHTSPEGKTPWYWFAQAGYKYAFAGENLAVNFTDSEDVTEAWMNSPTHRANIVAKNYREVGTGIATGVYEGKRTVFVAQVYASPVPAAVPTPVRVASAPAPVVKAIPKPVTPTPTRPIQTTQVAQEVTGQEVLGEVSPAALEVEVQPKQNFLGELMQSPKEVTNAILFVIAAIVVIALVLNIVIKFEEQHPDLIVHGVAIAVLVFAIHITNGYISENNFETSFIAFDSTTSLE